MSTNPSYASSRNIDLVSAETGPFDAASGHVLLASFIGAWTGSTRLWLDPAAPPEEAAIYLNAEAILGGRWLRVTYRGVAAGKPHGGEMLLGFHKDAGSFEMAWVDSFHTGSAIMTFTGQGKEAAIVDLLSSYVAGGQRWGWRTAISSPVPDHLLIESFNVSPQNEETPALEARLTRLQSDR